MESVKIDKAKLAKKMKNPGPNQDADKELPIPEHVMNHD